MYLQINFEILKVIIIKIITVFNNLPLLKNSREKEDIYPLIFFRLFQVITKMHLFKICDNIMLILIIINVKEYGQVIPDNIK